MSADRRHTESSCRSSFMHILCKKTERERSGELEQREKEEEDNRGQSQFSKYDWNFGHILWRVCLFEKRHVLTLIRPGLVFSTLLLLMAPCLCFNGTHRTGNAQIEMHKHVFQVKMHHAILVIGQYYRFFHLSVSAHIRYLIGYWISAFTYRLFLINSHFSSILWCRINF